MKLTLYGDPRTKKNSARILQGSGGRRFVAPSAAFEEYQTDACGRYAPRLSLFPPA